jgi:hypothetical protein
MQTADPHAEPTNAPVNVMAYPNGVLNEGTPVQITRFLSRSDYLRPFMRADWLDALAEACKRGYDPSEGTRMQGR